MRWHHTSEFPSPSHFRPISGRQAGDWKDRLHEARAGGLLTANDVQVARLLLQHMSAEGRCDPSHRRLATLAGCCLRSVLHALDRLKAAGLVDWTRRMVRTAQGARQTTSAFRLVVASAESLARQAAERLAKRATAAAERAKAKAGKLVAALAGAFGRTPECKPCTETKSLEKTDAYERRPHVACVAPAHALAVEALRIDPDAARKALADRAAAMTARLMAARQPKRG